MNKLSTVLISSAFLLIPAAIWFEGAEFQTWHNRLALPEFIFEPSRHTPVHTHGTFLPPTISENLTLTPDNNPVILTSTTTVPKNITVTINPGTIIYTHEFAHLIIEGELNIEGSPTNQVIFTTNEAHPLNQTWSGIQASPNSQVAIKYTSIEHASPAVTCLTGSKTSISNSKITQTIMGVFATSHNCFVSNTIIHSTQDGIVAIDIEPALVNNTITAKKNSIKKIINDVPLTSGTL